MPDFLPPKVVGELSTLNTYVIVENHQPGITLKVWADGNTLIGSKIGAEGGRDKVSINSNFLPLKVGTSITATQESPGEPPSRPSPIPVIIQAVPNPLNQARFEGTIYHCVDFLRTSGLTPGAKVEVHQPGASGIGPGSLIGQGETYNGPADIGLTQTVNDVNPLIIRQIAGPLTSDARYPMPIVPIPRLLAQTPAEVLNKLPQLTIKEALDCDWYVDVAGTITGVVARIKRTRNGNAIDFLGHGWDVQTRFWMPELFRANDLAVADQHVPAGAGIGAAPSRCDIQSSDPSDKYLVYSQPIHPPLIVPPVCLDAEELELLNIKPGADFAVYAIFKTTAGDKQRLIGRGRFPMKEPDSTILINRIEPDLDQMPDTVPSLLINQTACGWTSPPSPAVEMESLGAPTTPKFPDRLFACAVYVRVANVRAGSWVSVHSQLRGGNLAGRPMDWLGGRIGRDKVNGTEVSVYVPYGLIEGDIIWACATGCQNDTSHSDPKVVEAAPDLLLAQIVEPVYPSDTWIVVQKMTTGAHVITRVLGPKQPNGKKFYTSYAWGPEIRIFVGDLYEGDKITVFQGLCHANVTENQSNTVTAILGTLDVSIAPSSAKNGWTASFLVHATDPDRGNALVSGEVLINGVKVGSTNAIFAWAVAYNHIGAAFLASVHVKAAGYKLWEGTITVDMSSGSSTGPGPSRSPPGTIPPKPVDAKKASYSYTCKPLAGGIEFTVKGVDFPAGAQATITPSIEGTFTAFGQTKICGEAVLATTKGPFGPFTVDATGKFEATVTVLYGSLPSCYGKVRVSCNKPVGITEPSGPICRCS